MKDSLPSRRAPRTLALALLALGLVGAQALVFARAQTHELRAARRGRSWFLGAEQRHDLSFLSVAAWRSLSPLAAELPPDARVLLVSRSSFLAPYDFYLLPRRLRVLIEVDASVVERYVERFPQSARQARRMLEKIDARGQRLTPAHLAAALDESDWLIVFMGEADTLPLRPRAPRLVPVAQHEAATLFRVERSP